MRRCGWVTDDPLYQAYHDNEWGVAVTERNRLFEMLSLEGQQAGLSWITVLKKRADYQQAFYQFQVEQVAQMQEDDIQTLLLNKGLIRHRGKLSAIINNAQAVIAMEAAGENFSDVIWQFANHQQQVNQIADYRQIPPATATSLRLANALKKRGFRYVGATTCYAFMQACGLVNDHEIHCFCHPKNRT